jgi:hypothetical protein
MKKLSLLCALLLLVSASASAHEGAISLYADTGLNSCSMEVTPGNTGELWLLYVRDEGVEMGKAAEFRVITTSASIMFFAPTWEPYITQFIAEIPGNVSVTGATNFGCGLDVVPLGRFTVFNTGDIDTFYVKVVDNPTSLAGPGIYITDCSVDNNEVKIIGGTFVLTGDEINYPANCNPGVEQRTWGAIKGMYK